MANAEEAKAALDEALFGNVFNMRYDEDNWAITFEGDNYVLKHLDSGELFHFRVVIEEHQWDSEQARKDQEWGEEDWS